jgi:soluble P-type ATPase
VISVDIPGRSRLEIRWIVSDYTGTQAFAGAVRDGVRSRLVRLAAAAEIHVITADTFGTARRELAGLPLTLHVLDGGSPHDAQKLRYIGERSMELRHIAAFGNGNNDRRLLEAVKAAGGLAVAVDNGEGCALDALLGASLLVTGAENALDLLLEPDRCRATLRA